MRDNLLDCTRADVRGRVISTERRTSQDRYNVFAEDPAKGAQAIVTGGVRPELPTTASASARPARSARPAP